MKKIFYCILISCLVFTGCSSGDGGDKRVVAQVNNYKMSVEDLRHELRNIPHDDTGLLESEKGRKHYIDRLIEKEILLQEAQRQGLDREKGFMKSIENYWEQALLKLLLERKSKEILGLIHVYNNEMREYYRDSEETLPFSRVKSDIRRTLRRKKETEAMNAWIEELRKASFIKINKEILEDAFSNYRTR